MAEERLIEFDCECGAADCSASVLMTLGERDAIDQRPGRWAIAPGHTLAEADRLLERHERYWVVSGPGSELVERLAAGDRRLIEYGCECGAEDCTATVRMTFSERDSVDHRPERWSVAPGHALKDDRVVEQHERYWVLERQV